MACRMSALQHVYAPGLRDPTFAAMEEQALAGAAYSSYSIAAPPGAPLPLGVHHPPGSTPRSSSGSTSVPDSGRKVLKDIGKKGKRPGTEKVRGRAGCMPTASLPNQDRVYCGRLRVCTLRVVQ
eukprot:GHVU01100860.1.p2 GENE.GHVU01100860.1~~GHVU01100860.1.p2  ORF type:complete len:124 (-),score=5.22 GHVU01100860.1:233-604(-)